MSKFVKTALIILVPLMFLNACQSTGSAKRLAAQYPGKAIILGDTVVNTTVFVTGAQKGSSQVSGFGYSGFAVKPGTIKVHVKYSRKIPLLIATRTVSHSGWVSFNAEAGHQYRVMGREVGKTVKYYMTDQVSGQVINAN
jgi:hypothetical protein